MSFYCQFCKADDPLDCTCSNAHEYTYRTQAKYTAKEYDEISDRLRRSEAREQELLLVLKRVLVSARKHSGVTESDIQSLMRDTLSFEVEL